MKKLIGALVCASDAAPLSAWGQKWIEPYTDKDGTQVEGHWADPGRCQAGSAFDPR